jgi:Ion channel
VIQVVTTVGYGDVVSSLLLGRLVVVPIPVIGIAFMTMTTAAVTNLFVERSRQLRQVGHDVHAECAWLRARVDEVLAEVGALRGSHVPGSSARRIRCTRCRSSLRED